MESRRSPHLLRIFTALAMAVFMALAIAAQPDPNPNSPAPVVVTQTGTTRVLAQAAGALLPGKNLQQAFPLNSRIIIFVKDITPAVGEDARSLRVYAIDRDMREYRFQVLSIQPSTQSGGSFAVTLQLTDQIGYWQPPAASGNLALYMTWRGLASNIVHLSIGREAPVDTSTSDRTIITVPDPEPTNYVGYRWSGDRMRFLEQAAFGPNAALDSRIRRIGIRTWLAEQFETPYPSFAYPNQPLKTSNFGADPLCDGNNTGQNGNPVDVPLTCARDTYSMYPTQQWFMKEALYGDAQLRHRVSWALSQIWVTSGVDIQQSRHMTEYHKILSAHAFGNYRNLIKDMTLNPTMGEYLDMARSTRNNPNENYAREVMQLFSIGLFVLNPDGTPDCVERNYPDPCQAGDTFIPTYDQNVVNDLTKVLTGWTFCNNQTLCPNIVLGAGNFIDPLLLNSNNHDLNAKTLLSYNGSTTTNMLACAAPCNTTALRTAYANASLEQAIDNIFYHPNVGPFISLNLIRQMVTSDPTPQYVADIAAVFNNNGLGVRGDLKAVVKAILIHPEARGDLKTDPNYGKLREPVQFATNFLRALNVRSADGLSQSDGWLLGRAEFTGMGQVPFRSPTVFNYYPPDYVFSTPTGSIVGPEFALMTTGTAIQRANFINRFVYTTIPVPVSTDAPFGTSIDFADLQTLATNDPGSAQLMDELNNRMMHRAMSAAMRSRILTAVNAIPGTSAGNFILRAQMAVHLIATSSQYQVQR